MKVRVFHHKSLETIFSQPGINLTALKDDFKRYKESGVPPDNFGRDAQYNHPNSLPIVRQEKISAILRFHSRGYTGCRAASYAAAQQNWSVDHLMVTLFLHHR